MKPCKEFPEIWWPNFPGIAIEKELFKVGLALDKDKPKIMFTIVMKISLKQAVPTSGN